MWGFFDVSRPKQPGTVLDARFVIDAGIGGGRTGWVYRALDRRAGGRPVVVKEVTPLYQTEEETGWRRAAGRRLAATRHPSLPRVDGFFEEDGSVYLVMEPVEGMTLAEYVARRGGIADELEAVRWAVQLCEAFAALGTPDGGVELFDPALHHVMVERGSGRAVLLDFNLAREAWPPPAAASCRLHAVSRMAYTPPELSFSRPTPATPVYGLGAILFHVLTGSDPTDNPVLIFDFRRNPAPSDLNPAVTPAMEAIIRRAVGLRPQDRYGSVREMAADLAAHAARLGAG